MRKTCILLFVALSGSAFSQEMSKNKISLLSSIEIHQSELIALSDQVWEFAETALNEYKSSEVLANYLEKQGFRVERGVAEMPTAFVASYGSGKPIVGILGEYDALPGLSQKAIPRKDPLIDGGAGHGCGHNLFAPGSIGAAVAIKEMIEEGTIKGTVRFYGTPAEEAFGGKGYMARAGLFDDLDVCLHWHPGNKNFTGAVTSTAIFSFNVSFKGKSSHAAGAWNGISASDALELYQTGLNYLREHVRPSVRMHYLARKTGEAVNVVPDDALIETWIRDVDMKGINRVYEKLKNVAAGAALMTGAEYSIEVIHGSWNLLPNKEGSLVVFENMNALDPIQFTEEEKSFGYSIQKESNIKTVELKSGIEKFIERGSIGGSTDVGDVSWIVPTFGVYTTSTVLGMGGHSWGQVSTSGMSIGHKGMLYASKILATTMYDLFSDSDLLSRVRKEFETRKGDVVYEATLPPGPPPIPIKPDEKN